MYLTFDDGPGTSTRQVLDLLARYDAKATFFTIGSAAAAQAALTRRIVRDGHAIGNHTFSHADLTRLSPGEFAAEVERAEVTIRRITGTTTRWLRPPYGATNATVRSLAAAHGYRLALWDVDPQDWRRPGATRIASIVVANVRPGRIVLLHDGGGDRAQTVAALRQILATLSARGYAFAALQ